MPFDAFGSNSGAAPPSAQPHVRVLLATYNGAPWLDEQLRSIFEQQGVRVSVVASDHGSTDGTLEVLLRWRESGSRVEVLEGMPTGAGAAANFLRLLREAPLGDASFVALADQDDIWLPDHLSRAVAMLQAHRAVGYSSDVLAFWPDGRRARLRKARPQQRFDYLLEAAGPGCTYVMSAAFTSELQREFNIDPARFDDTSYHDWLIYAYARTHGHAWVIDEEVGLHYRQHERNDVGANVGLAGIRRRWMRSRSGLFRRQVLHMGRLWPESHRGVLAHFERFNVLDRLALAVQARELRRRPKDQLALFSMLLLGALG
jgi:rhamnosyltransferase